MYIVKIIRLTFATIVLLMVWTPPQAYFKDPGMGARYLGMGDAYVAAADSLTE